MQLLYRAPRSVQRHANVFLDIHFAMKKLRSNNVLSTFFAAEGFCGFRSRKVQMRG